MSSARVRGMNKSDRKAVLCQTVTNFNLSTGRQVQRTVYTLQHGDLVSCNGKVCQKFFTDVLEINSNYLTRARYNSRPSLGRSKSSPKQIALRHWLERQATFHEYMPDTVGAGRRDPAADVDPSEAGGPSITRHKNGVQLPYPNKKELYEEYVREMLAGLAAPVPLGEAPPPGPCKINYFRHVWRTDFRHLHLRKHLRFSRCDVCVELRERFGRVENHCPIRHKATQKEFREHINRVKAERTYYHKKREEAAQPNSDVLSIIFDGADQGSYGQREQTLSAASTATNTVDLICKLMDFVSRCATLCCCCACV
jgi:hypothetical protein